MSEDWRTDEPGNFQLAWIKKEIGKVVGFYRRWKSQPGGWWSNGMMMIGEFSEFPEWLPISTFEEERLRAEVERLREFRRKVGAARDSECTAFDYAEKVSDALDELKEAEAGWVGDAS